LNPEYEEAVFAIGYAQLGQNQLAQATESYQKLEKMSSWGTSLASAGLANLAMYEGRFRDAIQILNKGIAVDLAAKTLTPRRTSCGCLLGRPLRETKLRSRRPSARWRNSQSRKCASYSRVFVEAGEIAKAKKY
jgi:tetratricopeptide (TPR) repeat protein